MQFYKKKLNKYNINFDDGLLTASPFVRVEEVLWVDAFRITTHRVSPASTVLENSHTSIADRASMAEIISAEKKVTIYLIIKFHKYLRQSILIGQEGITWGCLNG